MHTTTDTSTEEANIHRLKEINTLMLTGTMYVLSQQLASSAEGIAATAAASIIRTINEFPEARSQVAESLAKDHGISLTDVRARAHQILASTPGV